MVSLDHITITIPETHHHTTTGPYLITIENTQKTQIWRRERRRETEPCCATINPLWCPLKTLLNQIAPPPHPLETPPIWWWLLYYKEREEKRDRWRQWERRKRVKWGERERERERERWKRFRWRKLDEEGRRKSDGETRVSKLNKK